MTRLEWARLVAFVALAIAGVVLLKATRNDVNRLQGGQSDLQRDLAAAVRANRQALCLQGRFTAPPLRRAHENDRKYRGRLDAFRLYQRVLVRGADCRGILKGVSAALPGESPKVSRVQGGPHRGHSVSSSTTPSGTVSRPGARLPDGTADKPAPGKGGAPGNTGPQGPSGPPGPGGPLDQLGQTVNQTLCQLLGNCDRGAR